MNKFHQQTAFITTFVLAMFLLAIFALADNEHKDAMKKWGKDWATITQFYYPHTHSRGAWYNQYGKNCCTNDCFPARPGTIKWTPEGWRVIMPDGIQALVPLDYKQLFIKPNPDGVKEDRAIACFYRSGFGEGGVYGRSVWRLRCLYTGRPRI